MQYIRIQNISDQYFTEAWALYEAAFPLEERRSLQQQVYVMQQQDYHVELCIKNHCLIGFIFWWNFRDFRYIDHFAVSEKERNKGLGATILKKFQSESRRPILLEVDLPANAIDWRRISFYERLGFQLNQHDYKVPSSIKGAAEVPLLVMTYPELISKAALKAFTQQCHPILFNAYNLK